MNLGETKDNAWRTTKPLATHGQLGSHPVCFFEPEMMSYNAGTYDILSRRNRPKGTVDGHQGLGLGRFV
jgi:hypothetical protein